MRRRLLLAAVAFSAAPPLGAQPWRLTVVPFAGRTSVGPFYERAYDTTFAFSTPGAPSGTFTAHTRQRLSVESARARGLRLELRSPRGWLAFAEGSHGGTRFRYTQYDSGSSGTASSTRSLEAHDDARLMSAAVGVGRSLLGAGWRPEVALTLGATVQRFEFERTPGLFCFVGDPSCDPEDGQPWEPSYTAPGGSAGLALRWPVARGLGIEARAASSLVRARTGGIAAVASDALRPPGGRTSDWVGSTQVAVGMFTRADVAPPGARQGAGAAPRLAITPFVGLARPGAVLDRHQRVTTSVERRRAGGRIESVPMHAATFRRIALEAAPTYGLRADHALRGAWSLFAEGAFGRTRFEHRDSLRLAVDGEDAVARRTYGNDRGDASVLTLAAGVGRELPLGAGPFAAILGAGASWQRVGLERPERYCAFTPGSPTGGSCGSVPWDASYALPGGAATLGLRWAVAPRLAVEARSLLTIGRVRNGDVPPSANEHNAAYPGDYDPPAAQWTRGARLTVGVTLAR